MLIPIRLEEEDSSVVAGPRQAPPQTRIVPVVTFPTETPAREISKPLREKTFGDILIPALSKYFLLRDSKRKDFQSLLSKEHPLHIENFESKGANYQLQLNVQKFKPEELHVKINDDSISILGEHEEKSDKHNYTKQQFLRRYSLPTAVNANDIKCELSSDGYLLISAPKIEEKVKITEIPVPMSHTEAMKAI